MEQASIFEDERLKIDLFKAYYNARKHKRNTINALSFEQNLENNILKLYDEIIHGHYKVKPSICFVVEKPVKREVFAADFRDRVVHHLIYNYIAPIFEAQFIYDSYSCRKGKGTLFGVRRVSEFMRACSNNYTQECYILKLDIQGYFMSINKKRLYDMIIRTLITKQHCLVCSIERIQYLLEVTIFNNPQNDCVFKSDKKNWIDLPHSKSLFHSAPNTGLPIGNLTSQLFANIYMNEFDHFMKSDLSMRYYGRYVDDFVVFHPDKEVLRKLIPVIRTFLMEHLGLNLHPKKIYLQPLSAGVKFLGVIILPYRNYIAKRTQHNFKKACQKTYFSEFTMISILNSYLGIFKHYKTNKMINKVFDSMTINYKNCKSRRNK